MSEDIYDELWEVEWIQIPDAPYITKYKFEDDGYMIMITDLNEIYGEKLDEKDVKERFCNINPYVEMKSKVILKHVKQSIENSLLSKDSTVKVQCTTQMLNIRLQFSVSQVFFIFDVKPQLLLHEKLRTHIIAPTVLTALSIHRENLVLKQKVEDLEKKECFSLSTQRTKEDQKMKVTNSRINKRSKILATDIMESFLHIQKNIKSCISDSKALKDHDSHSEQSSSSALHILGTNSSPLKGTVKDEFSIATNLKYEDMEESFANSQETDSSLNLLQPELSALPLKRDIMDLPKNDIDSSSLQPQQLHAKTKKKKVIKF